MIESYADTYTSLGEQRKTLTKIEVDIDKYYQARLLCVKNFGEPYCFDNPHGVWFSSRAKGHICFREEKYATAFTLMWNWNEQDAVIFSLINQ